jgi:hypothetical protein
VKLFKLFSLGAGLAPVGAIANSLFPPPHLAAAMTKVQDFLQGLARSSKSVAEIKTNVDSAFGDKALVPTLIFYLQEG